MLNLNKIGFISLGVALIAAIPFVIYASEVTVPAGESFNISLANGLTYTIEEASAATSIVVNNAGTSFTITTGSADTVHVSSLITSTTPPSGKDLSNLDETNNVINVVCKLDGSSKLTIGPSKTVVVTPLTATICTGGGNAGKGHNGIRTGYGLHLPFKGAFKPEIPRF